MKNGEVMKKSLAGFTLFVFATICFPLNPADSIVTTQMGKVSGVASNDGSVTSFKGIPFAAHRAASLARSAAGGAVEWRS